MKLPKQVSVPKTQMVLENASNKRALSVHTDLHILPTIVEGEE